MRSYTHATQDPGYDVAQLAHGNRSTVATPTAIQAYPATDLEQTKQVDSMVRNNLATGIQAKLTIGQPNDQYEQEADRVATQVMSTPDSAVQPAVQREMAPEEEELQTKPIVQREAIPEEEEPLQAKPIASEITPLVQREAMPEEEEEPVQMKSALSGGAAQSGFRI